MSITVDKTTFVALLGRKSDAISVSRLHEAAIVGSITDAATVQNFRVAALSGVPDGVIVNQMRLSAITGPARRTGSVRAVVSV